MAVDEVRLAAARVALDAGASRFLHGRRLAFAEEGRRLRRGAGDGARSPRRSGWRRAARWACSTTTRRARARRRRTHGLQPQPRHGRPGTTRNGDRDPGVTGDRLGHPRPRAGGRESRCAAAVIIGMGESTPRPLWNAGGAGQFFPSIRSRCRINALVPVEGTPLAERARVEGLELARMIATRRASCCRCRIVRLSAAPAPSSARRRRCCACWAGANSILLRRQAADHQQPEAEADRALAGQRGLRVGASPRPLPQPVPAPAG